MHNMRRIRTPIPTRAHGYGIQPLWVDVVKEQVYPGEVCGKLGLLWYQCSQAHLHISGAPTGAVGALAEGGCCLVKGACFLLQLAAQVPGVSVAGVPRQDVCQGCLRCLRMITSLRGHCAWQ